MISRRSLFGLALVPLAGTMPRAEYAAAGIGEAFMPALDMTECYYFQPRPPYFVANTDIHGTMRRIKLGMIKYHAREL
jgi:hypothetical protein